VKKQHGKSFANKKSFVPNTKKGKKKQSKAIKSTTNYEKNKKKKYLISLLHGGHVVPWSRRPAVIAINVFRVLTALLQMIRFVIISGENHKILCTFIKLNICLRFTTLQKAHQRKKRSESNKKSFHQ